MTQIDDGCGPMTTSAELVPFPAARRIGFIRNMADLMLSYRPDAAERTLAVRLDATRSAMLRGHDINDDALLFAGLWRLLPPYDGPPIDLWRGQLCDERVGASWTSSLLVARKFALYGTRLLELCDERGDFSEPVLAADVARRGLTARANAMVLAARQVTAEHIICAPCLLGYDYEDEYVVDPRGLPAQVTAAPLALSHPQSLHAPT